MDRGLLEQRWAEFADWLRTKDRPIRESSIRVYRQRIEYFFDFLQGLEARDFDELTVRDVRRYKAQILQRQNNGFKIAADVLTVARTFLKWVADPEQAEQRGFDSKLSAALRYSARMTRERRENRLHDLPILTEDDVLRLMEIAKKVGKKKLSARNSALIALMYSSGARISEALSMRIKDLYYDPTAKVWRCHFPESKHPAGESTGLLTDFPGDAELLAWRAAREKTAESLEEPLFLDAYNKRLTIFGWYHAFQKVIRVAMEEDDELAQKLRIAKRLHAMNHLLRHSRAKLLGQYRNWQYASLKEWLRDKQDKMVGYYVQTGGAARQLARERAARRGEEFEEEEVYNEPEIRCPACKSYVLRTYHFCPVCGVPLSQNGKKIHEVRRELARAADKETVESILKELSDLKKRIAQIEGKRV